MKRLPAYVCAFMLVGFVGCRPGPVLKPLDTLREIKIGRATLFGKQTILVLGGKLPESSAFCDWIGATCILKPGTFGGTETMSARKTDSGLISQFHFDYGVMSKDAVEAQIDDYTYRLGKPIIDSSARNGEVGVHKLVWADSATTFELAYETDPQGTKATALLSDNALARLAN